MRALALVLVMMATARAEPLMFLWDTDFGGWLVDRGVTVVATTVDGVTTRAGGKSVLRVRVDRALRGSRAGAVIELPFAKDATYVRPVDKARALHDQWQELALARGDRLVFLLDARGRPLAVLPAPEAEQVADFAAVVDAATSLEARVTAAMRGARPIRETFARAALGDARALTREEKARAIASAMADATIPPDEKATWALYAQGVFDLKKGADAANVEVVRGLLVAVVGGQDVADLVQQFLVDDWRGLRDTSERDKLVAAIPKGLRMKAAGLLHQLGKMELFSVLLPRR